jgi:hypothetical protein
MPHYYFHLCQGSHIIAHDMVGHAFENDEAARQHARSGGGLVKVGPAMPRFLSRYELKVVNEAGKDIPLFSLTKPGVT